MIGAIVPEYETDIVSHVFGGYNSSSTFDVHEVMPHRVIKHKARRRPGFIS
jgi:hypothetical protein